MELGKIERELVYWKMVHLYCEDIIWTAVQRDKYMENRSKKIRDLQDTLRRSKCF